ncbi:hypothetical protein BCR41DRAFT_346678 [Lobosporangium transversale]|uniref:Secreted protein n=1 Tax=Lobosporangium transversale TaxID=64571 RepID=A0A1Y2GYK2_9FUNG|nr:hypothetical protein BCR41DRAFT_346678 [Lobosporangium transversale]ORZ27345.1 hypothetical protein BCR41DRAFT_346678 [Lobosporangium transversale]|eukprot:XP_021885072.1 hypothetical protein BCR41DRAFT_346678 [Lobosporangium transversale]
MARTNSVLAVLIFCLMFLNVTMAWSCYCVDCGASKCVRREEVTRTVFKKGSKHWRQGYKNGEYHVWAVETGEKSWFYDLCDRNGAQGGTCF